MATEDTPASPRAKGERLKQLRDITGTGGGKKLSRDAIQRIHGLKSRTLQSWEEGQGNGLTEAGARKIIDIYRKEHIRCTFEWLMTGKGPDPKREEVTLYKAPSTSISTDPADTLTKEINHFKSLHPEAAILEIKDDAMAPAYLPGDTVAGVRVYADDILELIGKDCIVETKNGTMLRRLQKSTVPNQYNLVALNPDTKIERPTLYGVDVLTAAKVARIFRGTKW